MPEVRAIRLSAQVQQLIGEVSQTFETLRRYPSLVINKAAGDPLDTLAMLQDNFYSRIEPTNPIGYIADSNWEDALHHRLDMASESVVEGFWSLWSTVLETLRTQGVAVGPFSFHQWNDGDAEFVRAIWCLIRHLRPINVVETGVAHGMTSRFIEGFPGQPRQIVGV